MELKQQICSFENFRYAAFFPEDFSPEDPCTRGQVVTFLYRTEH